MLTLVSIITLVLLLSAFCSLAESSIVAFSSFRARLLAHCPKYGSRHLAQVDERRSDVLVTIIIVNTLVNIGGTALITALSHQVFEPRGQIICMAIVALLILVFAEIVPKVYASNHSLVVGRYVAWPWLVLERVCRPLHMALRPLLKTQAVSDVSCAEINMLIEEAKKGGNECSVEPCCCGKSAE